MTLLLAIVFGLLGIAIGSFLNVCIDRLPAGKSLAFPASHCDSCQHPLSIKDNIPIFSYLWLRGRCHYCGTPIPRRVLVVEVLTGALFTLLFLKYGLSVEFAIITIYGCIFLLLTVIDLEQGLLLNVIVYPAMVLALLVSVFFSDMVVNNYPPSIGILNALLGGAAGFIILMIPAVINPAGMGWGDVKAAGMIGFMTGFPNVFVAIMVGILIGGLWAAFLLLIRKKGRKDTIPFGPFLTLGCFIALLWGNSIIHWYSTLF